MQLTNSVKMMSPAARLTPFGPHADCGRCDAATNQKVSSKGRDVTVLKHVGREVCVTDGGRADRMGLNASPANISERGPNATSDHARLWEQTGTNRHNHTVLRGR